MQPDTAQALESAARLGALIRPALVALLLSGLWLALGRAQLALRQRALAFSAAGAFLIAWLAGVWMLALHGAFARILGARPAAGAILVAEVALVAIALSLLVRSRSIAAALDAAPAWWLVAFQGYRVTGLVFLQLWVAGILPASFAVPAGAGDTLIGIASLGTVIAFWRNSPRARTLALGVNLLGIADLLCALALGAASGAGASPLLGYPLVLVPTFGVPLALMIHGLSLWQLQRQSRSLHSVAVPSPPQRA